MAARAKHCETIAGDPRRRQACSIADLAAFVGEWSAPPRSARNSILPSLTPLHFVESWNGRQPRPTSAPSSKPKSSNSPLIFRVEPPFGHGNECVPGLRAPPRRGWSDERSESTSHFRYEETLSANRNQRRA